MKENGYTGWQVTWWASAPAWASQWRAEEIAIPVAARQQAVETASCHYYDHQEAIWVNVWSERLVPSLGASPTEMDLEDWSRRCLAILINNERIPDAPYELIAWTYWYDDEVVRQEQHREPAA